MTDFQAAEGGRIWSSGKEKAVKYRFSTFAVISFYISLAIIWLLSGASVFLFADHLGRVGASCMIVWLVVTCVLAVLSFAAITEDWAKRAAIKKFMKVLGIIFAGIAVLFFFLGGILQPWGTNKTPDTSWATTQVQTLTHNPNFEVVHIQGDENDASHFTAMATSPEESVLLEIHYTDGEWKAALK